jgi:hypothetical protein
MGSSRAWQPDACSRLCFVLASLACMVNSRVAQGDWVMVAAFDEGLATIKRWFRKPGGWVGGLWGTGGAGVDVGPAQLLQHLSSASTHE